MTTKFITMLNSAAYTIHHGPDVENGDHPDDIQLAIARWLAEYVIDNCEVNDAEVMTLEEALDVYLVVFEDDDYDRVEIELTAVDLGSAGSAEFRRIIAAHKAASEEEEAYSG